VAAARFARSASVSFAGFALAFVRDDGQKVASLLKSTLKLDLTTTMQHNVLKILVVEDNDALRKATLAFLQQEGHHVRGIAQAEEIDDILGGFVADVYVIDLNLPDEDGLSLTRRLRAAQPEVGIVIATARTQIGDRVLGYNSGADLYLTKPVDPQELRAGIRALGKRLLNLSWEKQAMVLDLKRMLLISSEAQVEMTASDALLLSSLARAPGHNLERWQIAEIVGGTDAEPPSASSLEMRISRLRKKLAAVGATAPYIKAQHKFGYTLCTPVVMR
jgi:DNA-binding response OmpR family regulator